MIEKDMKFKVLDDGFNRWRFKVMIIPHRDYPWLSFVELDPNIAPSTIDDDEDECDIDDDDDDDYDRSYDLGEDDEDEDDDYDDAD